MLAFWTGKLPVSRFSYACRGEKLRSSRQASLLSLLASAEFVQERSSKFGQNVVKLTQGFSGDLEGFRDFFR